MVTRSKSGMEGRLGEGTKVLPSPPFLWVLFEVPSVVSSILFQSEVDQWIERREEQRERNQHVRSFSSFPSPSPLIIPSLEPHLSPHFSHRLVGAIAVWHDIHANLLRVPIGESPPPPSPSPLLIPLSFPRITIGFTAQSARFCE